MESMESSTSPLASGLQLLLVVVVVQLLLKAIFFWQFGVWTGLFNPFTMSMDCCRFNMGPAVVSVRKIKVRPAPFGDIKKLVTLKFVGVTVDCRHPHKKQRKEKSHKTHTEETQQLKDEQLQDEAEEFKFDPDSPVLIYPNDKRMRRIMEGLLRVIPSSSIQFLDTTVLLPNQIEMSIGSVSLVTKINTPRKWRILLPFQRTKKESVWNSDLKSSEIAVFDSDTNNVISQILAEGSLSASFSLDVSEGKLSKFKFNFNTNSTTISILEVISVLRRRENNKASFATSSSDTKDEATEENRQHHHHHNRQEPLDLKSPATRRIFHKYGVILKILADANTTIEQLSIVDIPLAPKSKINEFLDNPDNAPTSGVVFGRMTLRSLNVNLSKILANQVGFDLKFGATDMPVQLLVSILSLSLATDFSRCTDYSQKDMSVVELASMSNLTLDTHSTVLTNVLKIVLNGADWDECRKETIMALRCMTTGLTVDMNTEQLSILLSRYQEYSEDKKKAKMQDHDQENKRKAEKKQRQHHLLNVYRRYLRKSYPWILFKVVVERPVLILKKTKDITGLSELSDTQMLILSPSMCSFEAGLNKDSEKAEMETRLDIPNLTVTYRRPEQDHMERILSLKDTQFKCVTDWSLSTEKFLISSFLNLSYIDVNLNNVACLKGLKSIMNSITGHLSVARDSSTVIISENSGKALNEGEVDVPKKAPNHRSHLVDKVFHVLPSWINICKVEVSEISMKIGARSIFMPVEVLLKENLPPELAPQFDSDANFVLYTVSRAALTMRNDQSQTTSDDDQHTFHDDVKTGDYFWKAATTVEAIRIIGNYGVGTVQEKKQGRHILTLPAIDINLYTMKKTKKFRVDYMMPKLYVGYSMAAHFLLVSSAYLLKNTIFDLEFVHKKKQNKPKKSSPSALHKRTEFLNSFTIEGRAMEVQLGIRLSTGFVLRADIFETELCVEKNPISLKCAGCRILVHAGSALWTRILGIKRLKLTYDLLERKNKAMTVVTDKIIINLPNNFLGYKMLDGFSSNWKLTRMMHKILKSNNVNVDIRPHESPAKFTRKTEVRAKQFIVLLEDDKFESDLAMIFQLGLIEQNQRLAKRRQFKNYLNEVQSHIPSDSVTYSKVTELTEQPWKFQDGKTLSGLHKKWYMLERNISDSWVGVVQEFKLRRMKTLNQNRDYFEDLGVTGISKEFTDNITGMKYEPPLLSVFLDDLSLMLEPPDLTRDGGNTMTFVNRVGDGYPLNSKFSTLFTAFATLRTNRLRIHLRDYPIPIAYIQKPQAKQTNRSLVLDGNVCFLEALAETEDQLRWVYTQMVPGCQRDKNDRYLSINVPRSITTAKFLGEITGHIDSDKPTFFTWGEGLAGAFRQLDHAFESWSKPKTDPSPRLGLWDKIRNMLHGYIRLYWDNPDGELRFNLKGSMDPYNVYPSAAGFSLVFKDDVCFSVNDPEREFERDLLIATAKHVMWMMPNYMSQPLPCWCSPKVVFLPADKSRLIIPSMYGYYLETNCYFDPETDFGTTLGLNPSHDYEKVCINVSGDVMVKLSFLFERKLPDGTRSSEFKPHYENVPQNPESIKDVATYDTYDGFRSQFIHMGLTMRSNNSQTNSIHLSPKALNMFVQWFKMFGNNITTPVKTGPLWGHKGASVKFARHLCSFKYLFDVSPLYIYHGYRTDITDPDNNRVIGLKAKVSRLHLDLHQRKELMVRENETLDMKVKVLSMKFHLGALVLEGVDVRTVKIEFFPRVKKYRDSGEDAGYESIDSDDSSDDNSRHFKFEIFDHDEDWIDLNDYTEVDLPSLEDCDLHGTLLPFMHSNSLCCTIHTHTKSEFGNEDSHECELGDFHFIDTPFNNVLECQDIEMKWNKGIRDHVFEYTREVNYKNSYWFSKNFKSLNVVDKRRDSAATNGQNLAHQAKFRNLEKPSEAEFDEQLRKPGDYLPNLLAIDYILVRLINLQLQMAITDSSDFMMLLATPAIDLQVVQIEEEMQVNKVHSVPFEVRFGTIFRSADLFVVYKRDVPEGGKPVYGSLTNWPVFDEDNSYRSLIRRNQILSNVKIIFRYDKISPTIENDQTRNTFYFDVPTFDTSIDSDALLAFSSLVHNLLIYSEPEKKKVNDMIKRLVLSTDFSNVDRLYARSMEIMEELQVLHNIRESMATIQYTRPDTYRMDYDVCKQISRLTLEQFVYMKTLVTGNKELTSDKSCKFEMFVTAEQFTVNLVAENTPFLTLEIGDSMFQRLELKDGSTQSQIVVKSLNIWNKDNNILYPELLSGYYPKESSDLHGNMDNMLDVKWAMGKPVGGIRVIEYMTVSCHPVKIAVEEKTGRKLMKFVFPNNKVPFSMSDDLEDSSAINDNGDIGDQKGINTDLNIRETISNVRQFREKEKLKAHPHTRARPHGGLRIGSSGVANWDDASSLDVASVGSPRNDDDGADDNDYDDDDDDDDNDDDDNDDAAMGNPLAGVDKNHLYSSGTDSNLRSGDAGGADEMMTRANKYFNISHFTQNRLTLCISIYARGKMRILNVNNFVFSLPEYHIDNKIMTVVQFVHLLERHVAKNLLKHSGKLIRNKVFHTHGHRIENAEGSGSSSGVSGSSSVSGSRKTSQQLSPQKQ